MSTPTPNLSAPLAVALAGAGRVGTAVAELLRRRGHSIVWVWSRSDSSARRAAELLGAPRADLDSEERRRPDLLLIGAADAATEEVASRCVALAAPGTVACHFGGSAGLGPLGAFAAAGGGACALHPVQSCPDVSSALDRLPGSAWGVTASPQLLAWAGELVSGHLGGVPVEVADEARPLWHAAATVASNGLVALLHAAESLVGAAGSGSPKTVLGPLVSGTLSNVWERGAAAALTGPAARGDVATIRRHVEAVSAAAPELVELYALTTRSILLTARRAGLVDRRAHDSISALLEGL